MCFAVLYVCASWCFLWMFCLVVGVLEWATKNSAILHCFTSLPHTTRLTGPNKQSLGTGTGTHEPENSLYAVYASFWWWEHLVAAETTERKKKERTHASSICTGVEIFASKRLENFSHRNFVNLWGRNGVCSWSVLRATFFVPGQIPIKCNNDYWTI